MSFCEHCIDLKELPGTPSGSDAKIAGVNTYVAKGTKKGTVVIATDIFGNGITNPKIVADTLAKKTGFTVQVPDIFPGGPIDPKDFVLPSKASAGPPSDDAMGKNFENFGAWMGKGNSPDKTFPIFKKVVQEAAKDGPVGAIGYCYGGKLAYLASAESLVQGFVLYHPSLLEPQEAASVKTPVLINAAELDPLYTGELKETWEKTLTGKFLDKRSKTYPNTVHGFGVRPDINDAKVKAGFEDSLEATSQFFTQVLA